MKHIFIIFFFLMLFNSGELFSQSFNKNYARIDVFNNQGQNIHDFVFSYDVVNGNHTCINNFTVVSNVNFPVSFNFQIYYNNNIVYTGVANTNALGSVFFNNAFSHCNVLASNIKIVVN